MGTGEENGRKDASVRVSPMWKKVVGFAAWTSVFTARLQKTLTPTKEREGLSFLASSAVNSYRDAGVCRVDSPAGEARGAAARSGRLRHSGAGVRDADAGVPREARRQAVLLRDMVECASADQTVAPAAGTARA